MLYRYLKIFICFFAIVIGALIASGCNSGSCSPTPAVKLQEVVINTANNVLAKGTVSIYTAQAVYSDGTQEDVSNSVIWSSSDSQVAVISTINGQNVVNAIAPGNSSITAKYQGLVSAASSVTVSNAILQSASINLLSGNNTIPVSFTEQLRVLGRFSDGTLQDITLSSEFSASQAGLVTLESAYVTGKQAGSVAITATATIAEHSASNDIALQITGATLQSININVTDSILHKGQSTTISAKGLFSDGTVEDLSNSPNLKWQTSNNSVVVIQNYKGSQYADIKANQYTPLAITVTASYGSIASNVISVSVSNATLVGISISNQYAESNIPILLSAPLNVLANYSDNTSSPITLVGDVAWKSSNSAVLNVANNGVVTANALGSTTITAQYETKVATISLNAGKPTLISLDILVDENGSNGSVTLPLGDTTKLSVIANYNNNTSAVVNNNVTLTINPAQIASVDSDNILYADALGSASITATFDNMVSKPLELTVSDAALRSIEVIGADKIGVNKTKQFIAMGKYSDGQSYDLTSDPGTLWTSSNTDIANVSATGDVAMRAFGAVNISVSKNGIESTVVVTGTPLTLVALGYDTITNSYSIFASDDNAESWTKSDFIVPETTLGFRPLVINKSGEFVLVGKSFTATSKDGVNWTQQTSSGLSELVNSTFLNHQGELLAATESGYVYSSMDNGVSWALTNTGTPVAQYALNSFSYSANQLVAVGNGGGVSSSIDNGVSWTPSIGISINKPNLRSIAYSNGSFIMAGATVNSRVFIAYSSATEPFQWNEITSLSRTYNEQGAFGVAANALGTILVIGVTNVFVANAQDLSIWTPTTNYPDGVGSPKYQNLTVSNDSGVFYTGTNSSIVQVFDKNGVEGNKYMIDSSNNYQIRDIIYNNSI